jgi:nuclear transport factor 2 (NTF2) superfamily protein
LELDLGDEGIANGSHIYGTELWEFDDEGCMRRRDESINDYEIDEPECKVRWER